jgi:hypothetical protein
VTGFGYLVFFLYVHAQGAFRRRGGLIALARAMRCVVCVACKSWRPEECRVKCVSAWAFVGVGKALRERT